METYKDFKDFTPDEWVWVGRILYKIELPPLSRRETLDLIGQYSILLLDAAVRLVLDYPKDFERNELADMYGEEGDFWREILYEFIDVDSLDEHTKTFR